MPGRDGLVEIRLPKCRLVLTETELTTLLATRPDLWAEAIRRGKVMLRRRRFERREGGGGRG